MASQLNHKRVYQEIVVTQDDFFAARRDQYLLWVRLLQAAASPEDYMRLQLEIRDHCGPVNLKKLELAIGLVVYAVNEIERTGIDHAVARRPIIRFVTERIVNPLANDSWH